MFAFTGSCPIPEEGQPPVNCQILILQTEAESPQTVANFQAIELMAMRSVEISSPLYLALFAIGAFRRYIIGRL